MGFCYQILQSLSDYLKEIMKIRRREMRGGRTRLAKYSIFINLAFLIFCCCCCHLEKLFIYHVSSKLKKKEKET
jgi:hypothetical protein